MSVDVTYQSREAVNSAIRKKIYAEANQLSEKRDWQTTEPFCFLAMPGFGGRLFGNSKYDLSMRISQGERVGADGRSDLQFLVDHLCRWSSECDLTWELTGESQPVGTIRSGQADLKLTTFLELLRTFVSEDELGSGLQDLDRIGYDPNSGPPSTYIT